MSMFGFVVVLMNFGFQNGSAMTIIIISCSKLSTIFFNLSPTAGVPEFTATAVNWK